MNQSRGDEWISVHNAFLEYAVDLGLPAWGSSCGYS